MRQKRVFEEKPCKRCQKNFTPRQSNVSTCRDCLDFLKHRSPCKCGCGRLVRNAASTGYFNAGCRIRAGEVLKKKKLAFRLPKTCIICNKPFLARQANANRCEEHSLNKKGFCKCGCGKEAFVNKSGYAHGCKLRGIKNTGNRARCGFKKGKLNPNTTTPQFQRFKLKWPDKTGRLFRSTLEARFSDLCHEYNIKFDYEVRVPLLNGKTKVVDFSLDNNEIFIEITGYAYSKWQKDFDEKFKIFKQTVGDTPIIILTYPDKLSLVSSQNTDRDVFIESIDNPIGILKKIQLFRVNNYSNKILKGNETVHIPQRIIRF